MHSSLGIIRVSIVVSIPACHAGDRGSIPRHGDLFFLIENFLSFKKKEASMDLQEF